MVENKHISSVDNTWDTTLPRLNFLMLNPETSKPLKRKCEHYAKSNGFGSYLITYLYSLVSEDISEIDDRFHMINSGLDDVYFDIGRKSIVVAAWGKDKNINHRLKEVKNMVGKFYSFGVDKQGYPLPLLSLSKKAKLRPYSIFS